MSTHNKNSMASLKSQFSETQRYSLSSFHLRENQAVFTKQSNTDKAIAQYIRNRKLTYLSFSAPGSVKTNGLLAWKLQEWSATRVAWSV